MKPDETIDSYASMKTPSTLVIQRWLPGPVDRIWRYLTDSELRATWLASGDMTLTAGSPVELVWRNDSLSAPDDPRPDGFPEVQRMDSKVIAVDPPRRLTIAWGAGEVTFDLSEKGDMVLLTLTHTGLDDPGARTMTSAGWHMHLDILVARVSAMPAASFWSGWVRLRDDYAARLTG